MQWVCHEESSMERWRETRNKTPRCWVQGFLDLEIRIILGFFGVLSVQDAVIEGSGFKV